jgi:hypothetical protein
MELAYDVTDTTEIRKRELEARAAAYATAITLGHGTNFVLPAFTEPLTFKKWATESPEALQTRLERIQRTVATLLDAFLDTT